MANSSNLACAVALTERKVDPCTKTPLNSFELHQNGSRRMERPGSRKLCIGGVGLFVQRFQGFGEMIMTTIRISLNGLPAITHQNEVGTDFDIIEAHTDVCIFTSTSSSLRITPGR